MAIPIRVLATAPHSSFTEPTAANKAIISGANATVPTTAAAATIASPGCSTTQLKALPTTSLVVLQNSQRPKKQ